jgi:hypothetical protein
MADHQFSLVLPGVFHARGYRITRSPATAQTRNLVRNPGWGWHMGSPKQSDIGDHPGITCGRLFVQYQPIINVYRRICMIVISFLVARFIRPESNRIKQLSSIIKR